MKNEFLAKSNSDNNIKETIMEHTDNLLVELDRLKRIYPNIPFINWDILELACIYHDLGKMNTQMQIKLGSKLKNDLNIPEIPHGYLSPAFLPKKHLESIYTKDELKVLYQSIYYHHTRPNLENNNDLKMIINEDLPRYIDYFKYDKIKHFEGLYSSYRKYVPLNKRINYNDGDVFYQYVMIKGLLNRIDYSASSNVPVEVENNGLSSKTKDLIHTKGKLNELQEYLIENKNENNVVIASTGIGKTEGALLWIGDNKGFFSLPLKVSINAIYDRIIDENNIGFDEKRVGLLHSDTYTEYLTRDKNNEIDEMYLNQTKRLGLPLTVCTLDQIVDFVFKYPGFELKLATLAYSKLVIDEMQMYSAEMIGYLLLALKYINDIGGKFTILTATLPNIIVDFLKELNISFKMPDKPFIKKDLQTNKYQTRHRIGIVENELDIKDIISNGYKNKKVLVIANTVKKAQKIYSELKEVLPKDYNLNLLHARFIKKDRSLKEKEILSMGQLSNNTCGIWVTTQIVEASLDIDFDVLYTELSEVSGLFQRMGRVYRNRELISDNTNIFIYTGNEKDYPSGIKNSSYSIVDFDIFKLSKESLKKYSNQILSEIDKMNIVSQVYSKDKIKHTNYYKTIERTIEFYKDLPDFEFNKSDVELREIYTESFIPTVVYLENKIEIDNLYKALKVSKDRNEKSLIKNKLKDYTVSWDYNKTMKSKCYDLLQLSKYEKIRILNFEYNKEIGLGNIYEDKINRAQ